MNRIDRVFEEGNVVPGRGVPYAPLAWDPLFVVLRQSANHVITAHDNQIRHMLTKPWDNSTSQDICQFSYKDLTDLVGVKMEISEKILKYY